MAGWRLVAAADVDEAWTRDQLGAVDLPDRLAALGLDPDDLRDAVASANEIRRSRALVAGITYAVGRLRARIGVLGDAEGLDVWNDLEPGPATGVVALLSLALTAPDVSAYHRARGVPADVSVATLTDLGRQVAVHRRAYGRFGLHTHVWETLVWSGALHQLGRLQLALQHDDRPGGTGWVLGTHVPRSGPLTPEAVDASFAAAGPFFATHFPEHPVTDVVCASWLLDPALAAALPGSNLADFQRRWEPYGDPRPGDADVAFFVFDRRGWVDHATLPTQTSLQRAAVDRWRAGGHWSVVSGRLRDRPR